MEYIKTIIRLLIENPNFIVVVSIVVGGFLGLIKYRENIKDKRFETYHKLIELLVDEQIHTDRKIKLDRQIAIVYELRNFPNYFDVSIRILKGLQQDWEEVAAPRILEEINLTLKYMQKNYFKRIICKYFL